MKFLIALLILINFTTQTQYNFEVAFPNLTFSSALDFQNAGDGTNRLFAVEQCKVKRYFGNE